MDGETRADHTLMHRSKAAQRGLLIGWFWAWPILGTLILSIDWHNPATLPNGASALFVRGLIGTSTAVWTIACTRDSVYWLPCIALAIVLALGSWRSWMKVA